MLPILAPLLSIGISLVDKLVDKTTGEKDVIKATLSRLANEGSKEQLEAEVQKLTLMIESDKAQSAINVEVAKQGGLGWRDWLGYGGTISIIFGTMGVWLLNFGINIANGFSNVQIATLPPVDTTTVGTLLTGMLGLAGVNKIGQNNSNTSIF